MMAFSRRFVVSILVNGQVLSESPDNSVVIPFGSEYTIRFRNRHHDRQAVVKLFIDGEEQSKGGFVIPANSYRDIERNSYSPRKFKFVAPTSIDAQDFGKDPNNTDGYNGVVEARFYLEKEQPQVQEIHHHYHRHDHWRSKWDRLYPTTPYYLDSDQTTVCTSKDQTVVSQNAGTVECCASPAAIPSSFSFVNEAREKHRDATPGVTVEGGYSSQTFGLMTLELEEHCTIIKLLLKGYHQQKETVEAVLDDEVVESTLYCANCGAKRKPPKANFCHVCGHRY